MPWSSGRAVALPAARDYRVLPIPGLSSAPPLTAAEGAQRDLHHEGMIDGDAPTVSITSNVIQGQDEAVVDIAHADLGLADVAGVRSYRAAPSRTQLASASIGGAENALAAVEEPDLGLGGVIAVHHVVVQRPKLAVASSSVRCTRNRSRRSGSAR